MMSEQYIRQLSREAAAKAAAEGLVPFTVEAEDLEDWKAMLEIGKLPRLPFPNIGDLEPEGWEEVDSHMVDHSGFGSEGERAYTAETFIREILEAGFGYAITEVGQFQLYVGKFKRVK